MFLVDGLLGMSVWGKVITTLVFTHITIVCVTVFLHRSQAHRSVTLNPIVNHFFRLWLWLTTGMVTKAWVAIHRKHHAKCEVEGDPHSPKNEGINKVLWEGAELYRAEAKNKETLDKYGMGTPDDWLERNVYTPFSTRGILVMLAIDVALFGVLGVTMWAIQMMWIPFFAAGVINGIGHYFGYRNYETPDMSSNIVPWGILIGGEELHNNHHAFASSAKLSSKWWEFDIGWMYICIMRFLGLAKVREESKLITNADKKEMDADTVSALVTHRFQLMDRYWRDVVLPVFNDERSKAAEEQRGLFKHARKLLIRDKIVVDAKAQSRLDKLLKSNPSLQTVYDYRLKLQKLWERGEEKKDSLANLKEWCQQAEASSIKVLQDFAASLKGYASAN